MSSHRMLSNFRILLGLVVFLIGFASASLGMTSRNMLVMAWNIDSINNFDPAQSLETVTSELLTNICSALVEFDKYDPAKIRPSMARSWDVLDDGKLVIFHLRDDLKFDDGRVATAHDLAWSMQRVVKLGFGYAQSLMDYGFTKENIETNIRAVDDTTLQMKFDKSYPIHLILSVIGQSPASALLDRQTLEKNSLDGDMGNKYLASHSACVGPYKLARWIPGERVVLQATEHYWGNKPKIKEFIIRHVAESASQRFFLEKGDVDIARDLLSDDVLDIEKQEGAVKINRILRPQSVYLSLNNRNPALSHEKVRLALRYLVDYDTLGKTILKGIAIPRASYMPLGVSGALDEKEGTPFKLDLEKAKQLMSEAGYPDGFKANFLIGSLSYMSPVAQSIQANARKIGIDLAIERMAQSQLLSRVRNGKYDMAIMGWNTADSDGHPPSLHNVFNPDPTFTKKYGMYLALRAGYYDERANKMVMDALFEKDQNKRLELYRDLQHYMLDHGPMVYLFQTYYTIGMGPAVKKWVWNSFRLYYNEAEK
ncbi:ABC dipeptide transporter, substrate-binding subunit DppA [Bartonella australis AUST/NH1]|uniref:ABC dipeptide transporter, substrate-binding subunit DppA n=1 Tax=Bartonella australis (strain Aust/NH1) TaxID=1094489 RepID=M1NZC7_BARAA|nr:ABC transporter substrate-binding protein [Bartonella australis]AGF74787.1 ABC dipeptide transporter, substrate-binding subunit DppA [Bartonella australis AUST/NH1]